jgi:hypothetical protein
MATDELDTREVSEKSSEGSAESSGLGAKLLEEFTSIFKPASDRQSTTATEELSFTDDDLYASVFDGAAGQRRDAATADAGGARDSQNMPSDAAAMPRDPPTAPAAGGDRSTDEGAPVDEARLRDIHENREVRRETGRLESALEDKIADPQARERIREDMEAFERRAASAQPPLSPEEVAKTYREVTRLLEARDNPELPVTAADRAILAEQILHHAANPSTIDQGQHSTCNVATIENRMFARNPSSAAELIRQVATEGQYVTRGQPPHTIEINPDSLAKHPPDGEESHNPPRDGQRSYASQIFQITAANVYNETHELEIKDGDGNVLRTYPPGTVEYRRFESPGSRPPRGTEALVDTRTGEPIRDADNNIIDYPNLADDPHVDIYNEITGANPPERGVYLANESLISGAGERVTRFNSEDQLRQELQRAEAEGRMPIILKVHTAGEPFYTDSGAGMAGGSGGAHVVTVTDYDPDTGYVEIDNQWGSEADHAIHIDELYRATMPPAEAMAQLERECTEAVNSGHPDYGKELELLRLRRQVGEPPMHENEFDRHLIYLTQQIVLDSQHNFGGSIDERTQTELIACLNDAEGNDQRLTRLRREVHMDVWQGIAQGNVRNVELPDNYGNVTMERRAEEIYNAVHWYGNETEAIYDSLERLTPSEYAHMDRIFREKHNMSIEQYLQEEMWDEEERAEAMARIRRAQGRS